MLLPLEYLMEGLVRFWVAVLEASLVVAVCCRVQVALAQEMCLLQAVAGLVGTEEEVGVQGDGGRLGHGLADRVGVVVVEALAPNHGRRHRVGVGVCPAKSRMLLLAPPLRELEIKNL